MYIHTVIALYIELSNLVKKNESPVLEITYLWSFLREWQQPLPRKVS